MFIPQKHYTYSIHIKVLEIQSLETNGEFLMPENITGIAPKG